MRFDIFQKRADAHVQKIKQYLQEANLARIEHQVAADHHAALAAMYLHRTTWLEQELANTAASNAVWPLRSMPQKQVDGPRRSSKSAVSWLRARGQDMAGMPESA